MPGERRLRIREDRNRRSRSREPATLFVTPSIGAFGAISTGNLMADCERWCRDNLARNVSAPRRGTALRVVPDLSRLAGSPDGRHRQLTQPSGGPQAELDGVRQAQARAEPEQDVVQPEP